MLPRFQNRRSIPAASPETQQSRHRSARRPSSSVFPPNPTSYIPVPLSPNAPFPLPATYLLWGVTFCSILTVGNRRCPQPRKVRVASVPLTARSSITREVRGPAALALQATTPPPGWHECSLLRCFSESSRQLGALCRRRTARKWRRPQQRRASKGGTDSSNPRKAPNPRHRRQYCLLLVCKAPLFLLGPSGMDEVPFRSRWRRMNTKSALGSRRLHL